MSPVDFPLGLSLVAIGAGCLVVFVVTAAICELVERCRKR